MHKKQKIVVIGLKGLPAFGGASRAGESVITLLSDKYEFTVLSMSSHTHLHSGSYKGFRQIVFKPIKNKKLNTFYYYIKCLIYVLIKEKFDLVHIHHIDSGFIIPFLRIKYKVLATARGKTYLVDKWSPWQKKMFRFFELLFLKFPNIIVGVSLPHIQEYRLRTKKEIFYIPNGININEDFSVINQEDYIFFAAGRIVEIKGLHVLLGALKKLNYKGKILVAGDLNHNSSYKKHIDLLAQDLNVKFLGLIKEKKILMGYLHYAKLFVFPSFVEGMSNMLLEAASMKSPLVCSNIPENMAVFNAKEVLFFDNGNVDDLAQKLLFALNNSEEMNQKSKNAFNKLKDVYNWELIAKKYDLIYQKLLLE